MHLSTTLPETALTLDYDADQHLLVARWFRATTLPETQAAYADILAAAVAHDHCRHWLLDVRRRAIGDPQLLEWFGEQFVPRLRAALSGPVSIAYFAMVNHETAVTQDPLRTNVENGRLQGGYFNYFNREDEALSWLAQQP